MAYQITKEEYESIRASYSVCNTRCSLFRTNWKQRYKEVEEKRRASVVRKILSVLLVVSIILAIPAYAMAEGTIGYVMLH